MILFRHSIKEFNVSKSEYIDYKATYVERKKTYGEKAEDSMSLKDRLRQKEQIVKERDRGHQTRQKDKEAR